MTLSYKPARSVEGVKNGSGTARPREGNKGNEAPGWKGRKTERADWRKTKWPDRKKETQGKKRILQRLGGTKRQRGWQGTRGREDRNGRNAEHEGG